MNAFEFLSDWHQGQCDGDWKHQYGTRISTLDNPSWHVQIDLPESLIIEYQSFEKSENDWFGYSVKNKVFSARGDPQKLETLISKFREIAAL